MPNIREEIESRGDANLRRKRQQQAYQKLETKIRKRLEAEYQAKRQPQSRNPLHMPKALIVLIILNAILMGIAVAMYMSANGRPDAILYAFLLPLAIIPTTLLVLYLRYLWIYFLYHVYWWFTLIIGLFITFGLVAIIVMSLLGNLTFQETVNNTFNRMTQQLVQPTQTPAP